MRLSMPVDLLDRGDYEDILDLLYSISEYASSESFQHNVLAALVSRFEAESGTFYITDAASTVVERARIATVNIDLRHVYRYLEYYQRIDPFFISPRTRTACRNSDIMTRQYWESLKIYREFLAPQRIYNEIDMYLHWKEDSGEVTLGVISLHRPRGKPAFSNKELMKARIIARHLTADLRQFAELYSLKERENLLLKVTQSCPLGIMVLNRNLVPIYWNSEALQILTCSTNQCLNANSLAISRPIVPDKLRENCLALNKVQPTHSQDIRQYWQMLLHSDENGYVKIKANALIIPLPEVQYSHERLSPSFLVFLKRLTETMEVLDSTSVRERHLTKREIEIVQCLCDGLSNKEIGDKLCISLSTVATHLRNIFEKAGAESRAKLVSQIQAL